MMRGQIVSVRGYLVGLVAVFACVAIALAAYGRTQGVADAKRAATERVAFQAELAAADLERGVTETVASMGQLATNPSISQLAEPNPTCHLTFTGAGHIDVVRADGAVLCSSADPPGSHAGAAWLGDLGSEARASGPLVDPTTGERSLLISAPLAGGGAVATFLELDGVPQQMSDRFGGPLDATFVVSPDVIAPGAARIAASAPMETIGWNVEASVPTSVATKDINDLNRRELIFLVTGLLVLTAAAWIVYRGLARPIHRLDAWVRASSSGQVGPPPTSGPSELVSLAENFEAMTRSVATELESRLQTERMLRRTDRLESLGHLAGGMAHDFNNALAVMLNYAEFAEDELVAAAAEDPERWAPVLSDVQGIGFAGQRAAGLTRQLLSFARGEAAEISSVDLNLVVSELGDMLTRTLGERIELRVTLAPDLGHLRADRGQLEQVLVNLAVNARDAMPDGGTLSIETSAVEVDEHNMLARPNLQPGPHVRLRVSDTGTGMDLATQEQALEPFFTTKPRGSGTGLGLATVYGIVTGFGGAIQLYSEPGLGTSVSIMFPVGDEVAAGDHVEPALARPRGRGETVLVIDDDDDVRGVAERILDRAGFQVITASSGARALELVAERPGEIALVLSDVVMPGMLGTELAKRLRQEHPAIPVLLMSGYAPPVGPDGEAFEDGLVLVDKPFSAALLLQKVDEALGRA